MRTSKPIETISYNSVEFLTEKLNELVRNHVINDYVFIKHLAEEDETRDHIHLLLFPNKLIDTMDLQDYFKELDPNNIKPLGCMRFNLEKSVDDWILYGQHFEPYLTSKLESRVYHYSKDDFVFYDEIAFECAYNHAFKGSNWAVKSQILELLDKDTVSGADLIKSGVLPLNMACSISAYEKMKSHTFRNGRPNHEGYFVDDDGVINEV